MISLKMIKPNFHVVQIGNKFIAFSYETPIAYKTEAAKSWVVTDKKFSKTTSQHVNLLLADSLTCVRTCQENIEKDIKNLMS